MTSDASLRADARARLLAALGGPAPGIAVERLAHALKGEGVGQVEMYRIFSSLLDEVEVNDASGDVLTDTMDLIWGGGWAKGRAIFAAELSDGRLREK